MKKKNYLSSIIADQMLHKVAAIGGNIQLSKIDILDLKNIEDLICTINNSVLIEALEETLDTVLSPCDIEISKNITLLRGDVLYVVNAGVPIYGCDTLPINAALTVTKYEIL